MLEKRIFAQRAIIIFHEFLSKSLGTEFASEWSFALGKHAQGFGVGKQVFRVACSACCTRTIRTLDSKSITFVERFVANNARHYING